MSASAPFSALDEMISRHTMQMLADVIVTRADGSEFAARSTFRDKELFGRHAVANDYVIEYREADAPDVGPGETLTIGPKSYKVQGDPQWINLQEKSAQLVETA